MKFMHCMDKTIEYLVFVSSFGFAVVSVLQIFCRVVLNNSLPWSEEAARYLFVLTVFFGAILCVNDKMHTSVDILLEHLPFKAKRWHGLAVYGLMFFFCMYLMVYGWQIAMRNMHQISSAMRIPIGYVYLCIPVSGLFMGMNCIRVAWRDWKAGREDRQPVEEACNG
jgi:TRAP-type C4-dicarboxylate transport system, small permease component